MLADQIMPYVWNAVSFAWPDGKVKAPFGCRPGPAVTVVCRVDLLPDTPGPFNTDGDQTSMKSTSAHAGHGVVVMSLPRDQKAGQRPGLVVSGNWMLASIRPY